MKKMVAILICCIGLMSWTPVIQAKVNINTAASSELETLPRIGPGLARMIVDYREMREEGDTFLHLRDQKMNMRFLWSARKRMPVAVWFPNGGSERPVPPGISYPCDMWF